MADITMPQLGETVTEGTITKWFKAVGESVSEDEPLFEVSTDKVDSEVPSPLSGTITEIKVAEGDTVDVGTVLAIVGDAAHSTSPQLGQGVNMGLLDALALAEALDAHGRLDQALDAYVRARRWHLRFYQALSLAFTPFYQAEGRVRPWIRDHVLGKMARLPLAPRLLAATVSGLLLDPRRRTGG